MKVYSIQWNHINFYSMLLIVPCSACSFFARANWIVTWCWKVDYALIWFHLHVCCVLMGEIIKTRILSLLRKEKRPISQLYKAPSMFREEKLENYIPLLRHYLKTYKTCSAMCWNTVEINVGYTSRKSLQRYENTIVTLTYMYTSHFIINFLTINPLFI